MAEIAMTPDVFADLQMIEIGALTAEKEETNW